MEGDDRALPQRDPGDEDEERRDPLLQLLAGRGSFAERRSSSGSRCSPRLRSSSRTCVTSSKNRGSSRVSTVRVAGRSMSTTPAMRPGRGLITTTRVERKTASEIECVTKTTVEASFCQIESSSRLRRSRVISSSAPNGSSISSSAGSNASARAIETRCCMPPESCHGWWSPNAVSSTRSSISCTRALRRSRSQPSISSGRRDVLRHRSPVEEDGVLEDDPVVAVDARLARRLAVHGHGARRRLDQVADHAQQRRLAAARRADQRDELAGRRARGRCPAAPSRCRAGTSW